MADAGAIGENGLRADGTLSGIQVALFSGIHLGGSTDALLAYAGRNDVEGNFTAPSQSHPRAGIFKDIFWLVVAGINTLTIDCKYTGAAPRIIIKQDPVLGILEDVILQAPAGDEWVTITATVTVATAGVVNIWRERTETDQTKVLYWDRLIT